MMLSPDTYEQLWAWYKLRQSWTPDPSNLGHCSNELSLVAQLTGMAVGEICEGFLFLKEEWNAIGPLHPNCISHAVTVRPSLLSMNSGTIWGCNLPHTDRSCLLSAWLAIHAVNYVAKLFLFILQMRNNQFGPAYGSMQCTTFLASYPGHIPTVQFLIAYSITYSIIYSTVHNQTLDSEKTL